MHQAFHGRGHSVLYSILYDNLYIDQMLNSSKGHSLSGTQLPPQAVMSPCVGGPRSYAMLPKALPLSNQTLEVHVSSLRRTPRISKLYWPLNSPTMGKGKNSIGIGMISWVIVSLKGCFQLH